MNSGNSGDTGEHRVETIDFNTEKVWGSQELGNSHKDMARLNPADLKPERYEESDPFIVHKVRLPRLLAKWDESTIK